MIAFMNMNVDKAKLEIVEVGDGGIVNYNFGRQKECKKGDYQPEIINDDDKKTIKKSLNLEPCEDLNKKMINKPNIS